MRILLLVFVALGQSYGMDLSEEGWRKRNHFTVSLNGESFPLENVHKKLSDIETHITDFYNESRNVALGGMTIILEDNTTRYVEFDLMKVRANGELLFVSGTSSLKHKEEGYQVRGKKYVCEDDDLTVEILEQRLKKFNPTISSFLYGKDFQQKINQALSVIGVIRRVQETPTIKIISDNMFEVAKTTLVSLESHLEEYKAFLDDIKQKIDKGEEISEDVISFYREKRKDIKSLAQLKDLKEIMQSYSDSEQHLIEYLNKELVLKNLQIKIRDEANGKRVIGFIVHVHSYRAFCNVCAASFFRECESEGGFGRKIQERIAELQNMHFPYFMLMGSYRRDHIKTQSKFNGDDGNLSAPINMESFSPFYPLIEIPREWEIQTWTKLVPKLQERLETDFLEKLEKEKEKLTVSIHELNADIDPRSRNREGVHQKRFNEFQRSVSTMRRLLSSTRDYLIQSAARLGKVNFEDSPEPTWTYWYDRGSSSLIQWSEASQSLEASVDISTYAYNTDILHPAHIKENYETSLGVGHDMKTFIIKARSFLTDLIAQPNSSISSTVPAVSGSSSDDKASSSTSAVSTALVVSAAVDSSAEGEGSQGFLIPTPEDMHGNRLRASLNGFAGLPAVHGIMGHGGVKMLLEHLGAERLRSYLDSL